MSTKKLLWMALYLMAVALFAPTRSQAQSGAWSQLSAGTGPSARKGHTAIYDAHNHRMIVFGGESSSGYQNDVWAVRLGCSTPTWSQLSPSGTAPQAREDHSAIYDPTGNRMIVFGGEGTTLHGSTPVETLFNDVWALSLGSSPAWSQLSTSGTSPCPRSGHTAVYDALHGRMIVFGGVVPFCSQNSPLCGNTIETQGNFALTLSSLAWTPYVCSEDANCVAHNGATCTTDARPSPREYHSAIFDGSNRIIIFGGWYEDEAFSDTRSWDVSSALDGTWANMSPGGTSPGNLQNHRAIYDTTHNRMLVFGGDDGDLQNGLTYSNTTYALSLGSSPSWSTLSPSGTAPAARSFSSAIYDPIGDRMLVFGGTNGSTDYSDLWALTVADATAPAQVTNLAASLDCGSGVVTVTWTAPGDDGRSGTACSYDLRWYDHTITTSNWSSAWHLSAPTPQAAGGSETFQDSDLPACTTFHWALKTTDDAGNVSVLSNNAGVTVPCDGCGGFARPAPVDRLALFAPTPNPTRGVLQIAYAIPLPAGGSSAQLGIFDVSGRRVRLLRQGPLGAGAHAEQWDLRTENGSRVAAGLYFVRLRVGGERLTRPILVSQ